MGTASKIIRYGIVFIIGYYIGAGGCSDYLKEKQGHLEKKVQEQYYGRANKNTR